ncbi:hypothetical protein P7L78_01495 (plasmid) [Tistrella bauzanensis]|uniref:hypothetical protein n=1 Tax=Tistrella TaxID=171436 RepID=UPI0031F653C9
MPTPRLTILPFLQSYDAATARLTVNLLLIPVGDPALPLSSLAGGAPVAPAFQGAAPMVVARLSDDAAHVATLASTPATTQTAQLAPPPTQAAIFDWLRAEFSITQPAVAHVRSTDYRVRKYLPLSYRRSHGFVAPKTALASIDDTYHCLLNCPPPATRPLQPPSDEISWGEAFAVIMRQPVVARAAGLIHSLTIDLPDSFPGGWLFFSLDAAHDFGAVAAADAEYLKLFATRVPALSRGIARPVFTATLFPVAVDAAAAAGFGALDRVFPEAAAFDDGFAKIVHARQPVHADSAAENEAGGPPLKLDPGIQLAWDDEDTLVATNRAVGTEMDGSLPPDAPSAVLGYRIDVRAAGDAAWTSLTAITSPGFSVGAAMVPGFAAEQQVEVHPMTVGGQFWLPAFFTRWAGGSLTAPDDDEIMLRGPARTAPLPYAGIGADAVPLRYGRHYEFRVRLADTTGGGPAVQDAGINPAPAPVAGWHFRRHIAPGPVTLRDVDGAGAHTPRQFRITRPVILYPQAVFTGAPGAYIHLRDIARANQLAAPANRVMPAMPDPDADHLEIRVLVAAPRFDPAGGHTGFTELYRTHRAFPPLVDLAAPDPLDITLDWVDCARLTDLAWPAAGTPPGTETGPLRLPTDRQVRIEIRALGRNDPTYFGSDAARHGAVSEMWAGSVTVPAAVQAPLLRPTTPQERLASVFLQPDGPRAAATAVSAAQAAASPLMAERLAAAVRLVADDGTLYGAPGRRTVFGCAGLKHHLAPDYGALTLTSAIELERVWLNVIRLTLDRDWSWIGLSAPAIQIHRRVELRGTGQIATSAVGRISMDHAVNQQAFRANPQRDGIDIVFVDALEPPLDAQGFPHEVLVTYTLTARFSDATTEVITLDGHLPVATAPEAVPRVVSAGHAFSDYAILGDYEGTGRRQRLLWLEFDADPRKDPRDIYYARMLSSTPDPMLMPGHEPAADPAPHGDLDLDPETVRVIRPGQGDDHAGLGAMQPLIKATDSDRHYALPLPAHLSRQSAELFGFFTYELRLGHPEGTVDAPFWSTAQARFGPGLVLDGVQHPAPDMGCAARRTRGHLALQAGYATPVLGGRLIRMAQPNTDIWFVLYGRVMQADGASWRNIQIDMRRAQPVIDRPSHGRRSIRPPVGRAVWSTADITARLDEIGFDPATPLTALAVELLPEPNGAFTDPLAGDLGEVRILRSSPLIAIDGDCCPPDV